MKKINKIDPIKSPQAKNVRFIKWLEKQNLKAYRMIASFLIDTILSEMSKQKLAKSDELPRGWTGEVPKIEMDIVEKLEPVMDKYLKALKWLAIGRYAGKEALEAAKEIGLVKEFVPGSIVSSYLNAIDTERSYLEKLTEEKAPELPKNLLEESITNLVKGANPSVQYMMDQIRYTILQTVATLVEEHNSGQTDIFRQAAGELDDASKQRLAALAAKAENYIEESHAKRELRRAFKNQEKNTVLGIQDHVAKGGSTGTHQAIYELHGTTDDELKVIWVTLEDEKVCKYCDSVSKDARGEYIVYKMSDFKPYGANKGKKQKDWVLTVTPAHPHCRCRLVYVPQGFTVENGEIVRKKV